MSTTRLALAACALASVAAAQYPIAVQPRLIEIPLGDSTDSFHSLAAFDNSSRSEIDAVLLRKTPGGSSDAIYVHNIDGAAFVSVLAGNVDVCHPLMGGASPCVLCANGGGVTMAWRSESGDLIPPITAGDGSVQTATLMEKVLSTNTFQPMPGDIVHMESQWIRSDLHLLVAERSSGQFDCYVVQVNSAQAILRGTFNPTATVPALTSVGDWQLGDLDNDGTLDLLIVGDATVGSNPTHQVYGLNLVSGAPVGPGLDLGADATNCLVLGTQRGANSEVCAVYQDANMNAVVKTWVGGTSELTYATDWSAYVSPGTGYANVVAGDIDNSGSSDLVFNYPGSAAALTLLRVGDEFTDFQRRAIDQLGTSAADPGLAMCIDSNNSKPMSIGSGDDYHVVRYDSKGIPVLAVVSNIANALDVDPGQSQMRALWTTGAYTDFITDFRITDNNGQAPPSAHLKIEFSSESYFAEFGYSLGDQILLEIRRWDQTIPFSAQFPSEDGFSGQMTQWEFWNVTNLVEQGTSGRIELPDYNPDIGPRFNVYCVARFYIVKSATDIKGTPAHRFGISSSDAARAWHKQLRPVSSGTSVLDEIHFYNDRDGPMGNPVPHGNGVGGKDGDGVKKPNGLFPVSTANPEPAPGQPGGGPGNPPPAWPTTQGW